MRGEGGGKNVDRYANKIQQFAIQLIRPLS